MKYTINSTEKLHNFLIENEVATEDEISLVTSINGYNEEAMLDILYSRCGLRSIEQAKSEGFYMGSVEDLLDDDDEDNNDEE